MAITKRVVRVVGNPGRRRRTARKTKRNLSAKQIKFFGTPAQKAALKRSRSAKRSNTARKATAKRHKRHTRRTRRNIGEILSLTLPLAGNPPRRKARKATKARKTKGATTMAKATRRRRRRANAGGHRRRTVRRRRLSAAPVHHRRRTRRRSSVRSNGRRRSTRRVSRRNAGGGSMGFGAEIMDTLWLIGGAVGTQMLTQAVLGSSNSGVMGYAGNFASGFGLSFLFGKVLKMPKAGRAMFKGAVLQIVLRAIRDYTPFGSYTSNLGMGDYIASNWVTPQRYVDPMRSAQVQIPAGWAPQVAAPAGGGMKGITDFGALYSPAGSGLYN